MLGDRLLAAAVEPRASARPKAISIGGHAAERPSELYDVTHAADSTASARPGLAMADVGQGMTIAADRRRIRGQPTNEAVRPVGQVPG